MEESDVAEAKESKDVKVKCQAHVDRVLRRQGHCAHGVLATGTDDQSACLQRHPEAFASCRAREEARLVAEQIIASSPR